MRRVVKLSSLAMVLVIALVGTSIWALVRAARRVPEFYQVAVALEPASQQGNRDAFVARAAALASDLNTAGSWQSLFTADEINAWLALELSTNYPDLLPEELRDPRLSLSKDLATIGCLYRTGEVNTVVTVRVEAYLHSRHVVAVRILGARAGAIPVPLGQILDGISYAARQLNVRLEWRHAQGDPVALIMLPHIGDKLAESLCLESLEIRDGELYVAGTVGNLPPESSSPIIAEPLLVPTVKNERDTDQPRIGALPNDTLQK